MQTNNPTPLYGPQIIQNLVGNLSTQSVTIVLEISSAILNDVF